MLVKVSGNGRMRRRAVLAASVGLLVVAAAWWLWPGRASDVAIPERVCQQALSTRYLKEILPREGEEFKEQSSFGFRAGSSSSAGGSVSGRCLVSGGGETVVFYYGRILEREVVGDLTEEGINREAAMPGKTHITLGSANGYLESRRAEVFLKCPYGKGRKDLLEVSVDVPDASGAETKKMVSGLAADTIRTVTHKLVSCYGGSDLPDGLPVMG